MTAFKAKNFSDTILNLITGTTTYLGLLVTMPTDNLGTGIVELSGNGYARQQMTAAMWAGVTTNADKVTEQQSTNAQLQFPVDVTANWGTIVGARISSALTGGTDYLYLTCTATTVTVNGQVVIAVGGLTLAEV